MAEQCCEHSADASFGPVVPPYARSFDFTLLFEQSILALPIDSLFVIVVLWRIRQNLHLPDLIWNGRLLACKLLVSGVLVATLFANLLLSVIRHRLTGMSTPAASVAFIASLAIPPLSYLEHRRSIRPSALLSIYLLSSTLLSAPQARTLFLITHADPIAGVWIASLGLKFVLFGLEVWEKKGHLPFGYEKVAAEVKSGFFNRTLFLWLNSLFWLGFHRPVTTLDLGDIDPRLHSSVLHARFRQVWRHQIFSYKPSLVAALWRGLRGFFLAPLPARLCYGALLFCQPFLIHRTINYLREPMSDTENSVGIGLIGATALIYIGIAVANVWYKHSAYRSIVAIRGALVSLIYTDSISNESNLGDPQAAVTLMSTDIDRICQSLIYIHEIWFCTLELGVGVALLALQTGWVCVMPLAVVLVSIALNVPVTMTVGGRAKAWTTAVQKRVSLTASVLSSIKSIKILRMEQPAKRMVQAERIEELEFQTNFRWSTVWLNTIGNIPMALAPAVTFVTLGIKALLHGSQSLDISLVFTSLALISLVTTPANELLSAVPYTVSSIGSLQRIQEYLLRQNVSISNRTPENKSGESQAIKGPTGTAWAEGEVASLKDLRILVSGGSLIHSKGINLSLVENSVTVVTGPSGCGKSTLLRAILGHQQDIAGSISVRPVPISYCPESPWLFDGTIRENICGLRASTIDHAWYQEVLHALLLDRELQKLPIRDCTIISGTTSALNKEQKQRIALARALYHKPKILILDDVFRPLDSDTEAQILTTLFGPNNLLRHLRVAVVLATHSTKYNSIASTIIRIDEAGEMSVDSGDRTDGWNPLPAIDNSATHVDEDKLPTVFTRSQSLECARVMGEEIGSSTGPVQLDGDISDYVYYFKAARKRWFMLFMGFTAANTICYYMSQEVLQWWSSEGGLHAPKWMSLYVCLALGNLIFFGFSCWVIFHRIVPESAASLHQTLLDSVMDAPYSFLVRAEIGTLLNRFSQDMTVIDGQLPTGLLCTATYLFWTFGSLALICTGSSFMAAIIPAVFVVLYFLQKIYLRTSRQIRLLDLETRSPLYSHFLETLAGVSSIRAFEWTDTFTGAMISKLDASQTPYYLLFCAQRWLNLVLDLIVAGLAIVVVAMAVKLRSSTNPALLGLSLNNILTFNTTLSLLLQFWTQLEVSLGAIKRTRGFASQTPVESHLTPLSDGQRPSQPQAGALEIRDLSSSSTENCVILDGITMTIKQGEKIGICGRAGSGKTSLLLAILGHIESSPRSVSINDIYLANMSAETLRSHIIAVPQDSCLFNKSVRINLDPQNNFSDEQLIAVLTKVNLWSQFEGHGGLDRTVEPNQLPQGQKQLFNMARAVLNLTHPAGASVTNKILLLDDVTGGVDAETETLMRRVLRDELNGLTTLIVARRLEVLLDCDRVAVLDRGRLLEFDTPQSLLASDSTFAMLYGRSTGEDG